MVRMFKNHDGSIQTRRVIFQNRRPINKKSHIPHIKATNPHKKHKNVKHKSVYKKHKNTHKMSEAVGRLVGREERTRAQLALYGERRDL